MQREIKNTNRNAYYTLEEARERTLVKSRFTLVRYIDKYRLAPWSYDKIEIFGRNRSGRRYKIKGSWIKEFNKRFAAGKLTPNFNKTDDVNFTLRDLVDYAKMEGVTTIQELVDKVKAKMKKFNKS